MPAQARKRRINHFRHAKRASGRVTPRFKKVKLIFLALFFLAVILALFLMFFGVQYWNGKDRIIIASSSKGGDIQVDIFDPENNSITVLNIPADTEVDVARQLGTWRAKNLTKLGEKEGVYGELLAETLTKHFQFPVFLWGDSAIAGLTDANLGELLRAVFSPYRSNVGIADRIRIASFSMNVKNFKKETIDLKSTRYLKEATLSDGEKGYVVVNTMPSSLLALFSESSFSKVAMRTKIIDKTKEGQIGRDVGKIIEVMGLKVVAVNREDESDANCTIEASDGEIVKPLVRLFACDFKLNSEMGSELTLTLGEKFALKF